MHDNRAASSPQWTTLCSESILTFVQESKLPHQSQGVSIIFAGSGPLIGFGIPWRRRSDDFAPIGIAIIMNGAALVMDVVVDVLVGICFQLM